MPGRAFRHYEPDQLLLLPQSLRDWLPADHLQGQADSSVRERLYRSLARFKWGRSAEQELSLLALSKALMRADLEDHTPAMAPMQKTRAEAWFRGQVGWLSLELPALHTTGQRMAFSPYIGSARLVMW